MTTEPIIETKPKRRVKNFALLSNRAGAMFLTPAGLLVSVFVIVPFFWVIFVSFTNRTLLGSTALNPEFVGLANYVALFDGSNFFQRGQFGFSLILTTQFVLASALLGQALLGLLLAWLIQTVPPAVKRLTETFVIAAWIL
ncbi:MAG: sugar ABC transporter permease, partial [Devosia sp.]